MILTDLQKRLVRHYMGMAADSIIENKLFEANRHITDALVVARTSPAKAKYKDSIRTGYKQAWALMLHGKFRAAAEAWYAAYKFKRIMRQW